MEVCPCPRRTACSCQRYLCGAVKRGNDHPLADAKSSCLVRPRTPHIAAGLGGFASSLTPKGDRASVRERALSLWSPDGCLRFVLIARSAREERCGESQSACAQQNCPAVDEFVHLVSDFHFALQLCLQFALCPKT